MQNVTAIDTKEKNKNGTLIVEYDFSRKKTMFYGLQTSFEKYFPLGRIIIKEEKQIISVRGTSVIIAKPSEE